MPLLTTADAPGLTVFRRGKVRDTFDLNDGSLLMVASDRISVFDVVLPTPIPDKGRVLTQMSRWWFERTQDIVPNHLLPDDPSSLPPSVDWAAWSDRSMRCRQAQRIDIECVVRGYLAGSGWAEYQQHGTLAEEALPAGLHESSRLPEPRFTPAAKNDDGHDENISRAALVDHVGPTLAKRLEDVSLRLFAFASTECERAGVLLCDTKFEFGIIEGELVLIDEIFTPDSSRFWELSDWREGISMPSFDKQYVRDYAASLGWNKTAPGPELPDDIVAGTRERYIEAGRRVCGLDLS